MLTTKIKIVSSVCLLALTSTQLWAQASSSERKKYQLLHQQAEIKVDGVMDEAVWQNATKMVLAYENNPGEGNAAPVKTEVYFFENGESFNVAIKAYDPNPQDIRASYRDRDALWNDDNVGIIIDTFNDERSGYEFFVNPLGAQADMRMDDSNGWNEDASWDAIWDSAARITDEGYVVEMSIPFSALRFPEADGPIVWNVAGWRNYPREVRYQLATYKRDRNVKCNLCQFGQLEGFSSVKPSKNFQLTPTLTMSRADEKPDVPGEWVNGDVEADPGLDVRWGVTKDIVLNATINPDFSQVEADAGQLNVNNTFSLFYPEKRPFFLDGASYFDTTNFNFVHTRNIADPDYGAKVTGKSGDHSYGVMIANDNNTTFILPGNQGSNLATLEEESDIAIARYKMDVGERNNVGVLLTHRNSDIYENTLVSVDSTLWLSQADSLRLEVSQSESTNPEDVQEDYDLDASQKGTAYMINYSHRKRDYSLKARYESVDEDFRADMGFMSRANYSKMMVGGDQTWFGEQDDWLTEWGYFGDWDKSYDQDGNVIEEEIELHGTMSGQMQFFTNFGIVARERLYNGEYFDETQGMAYAQITPMGGLKLQAFTRFGKQIDYANTRLGDVINLESTVTWDVNKHLIVDYSHNYSQLDVLGGQRLFTANQSDLRLGYKFTMRSILKFVIQYTDIERDPSLYVVDPTNDIFLESADDRPDARSRYFSTQLIYSYKINPQTLFFIGYSDGGYQDDLLSEVTRNQRSVFTKFSYAWQL